MAGFYLSVYIDTKYFMCYTKIVLVLAPCQFITPPVCGRIPKCKK
jgi:hypothetical protein